MRALDIAKQLIPGLFLLTGLLAASPGCLVAPAATPEHGDHLFSNYCLPCHGATGDGKAHISAPAIAGLPTWYVQEQLDKFRKGHRGTHFDDIEGMRMRPMSLTLRTETDVTAVSMFVATLPKAPGPDTVTGDAAAGRVAYATCSACHNADGTGNEQLGSPPLTVQNDWYLLNQLDKFKLGVRGANPKDIRGNQMRPMAMTLPDEQSMKNVVAYIKTLRK